MVSWLRIHIAAWKVNRKYDLEALNQFLITCLGMESNLQEIYGYMKPPTGLEVGCGMKIGPHKVGKVMKCVMVSDFCLDPSATMRNPQP